MQNQKKSQNIASLLLAKKGESVVFFEYEGIKLKYVEPSLIDGQLISHEATKRADEARKKISGVEGADKIIEEIKGLEAGIGIWMECIQDLEGKVLYTPENKEEWRKYLMKNATAISEKIQEAQKKTKGKPAKTGMRKK